MIFESNVSPTSEFKSFINLVETWDAGINPLIPLRFTVTPPFTTPLTFAGTTSSFSKAVSRSLNVFSLSTCFLERTTFPSPSFISRTKTSILSPTDTTSLVSASASLDNSSLVIIPSAL